MLKKPLSIIHCVAGLFERDGGPSRSVTRLVDSLALDPLLELTLISHSREELPEVLPLNKNVNLMLATSSNLLSIHLGLVERALIRDRIDRGGVNIIHSHGLWHPANHWAAYQARKSGIPLFCHPRGMVEPWALNSNRLKKRLAMALYQRRDLESVDVFIATSEMERESLRRIGLSQPVAVIPNGVDMPIFQNTGRRSAPGKETRTALFLSRVQSKKGLLNLIDAWARLRPKGWRLQIAGPDEGGHLATVMARLRQAGVTDMVTYVGEVDGPAKAALYRSADLFVLPTFSENFGLVVAEALAHGLPVITTHGAPWADLVTYDCGWWIPIGVEPLIVGLRNATTIPDVARQAMGARGVEYVRRYDWVAIAEQTASVYRWILGQANKPECVRED